MFKTYKLRVWQGWEQQSQPWDSAEPWDAPTSSFPVRINHIIKNINHYKDLFKRYLYIYERCNLNMFKFFFYIKFFKYMQNHAKKEILIITIISVINSSLNPSIQHINCSILYKIWTFHACMTSKYFNFKTIFHIYKTIIFNRKYISAENVLKSLFHKLERNLIQNLELGIF